MQTSHTTRLSIMIANIYFPTREEIAAWPTPNYDDPVRRLWILPYTIIFQLIAFGCVVARLYVRLRMRKDTAGIDDVFLVLGLVSTHTELQQKEGL
jgi:hypothetical protein